jgi:hypothetical protein
MVGLMHSEKLDPITPGVFLDFWSEHFAAANGELNPAACVFRDGDMVCAGELDPRQPWTEVVVACLFGFDPEAVAVVMDAYAWRGEDPMPFAEPRAAFEAGHPDAGEELTLQWVTRTPADELELEIWVRRYRREPLTPPVAGTVVTALHFDPVDRPGYAPTGGPLLIDLDRVRTRLAESRAKCPDWWYGAGDQDQRDRAIAKFLRFELRPVEAS